MKKLFFILALAIGFASCQNSANKTEATNDETLSSDVAVVQVAEFETLAGDLVGKTIQFSGTVDHVCKHGGQRMFIVDNESEARIKITPAEEVAAFNTELVGDQLLITGIVEEQRIDEAYLMEWEEEIKAGSAMSDDKGEGTHLGGNVEKGGEGADVSEEMQKVINLREQLQASGNDYLAFYSVVCTGYEVVQEGAPEEEVVEVEVETETE
ncbi:MAG TPA: hypothetical protein VIN10_00705 [Bacteroidales bacterium]